MHVMYSILLLRYSKLSWWRRQAQAAVQKADQEKEQAAKEMAADKKENAETAAQESLHQSSSLKIISVSSRS